MSQQVLVVSTRCSHTSTKTQTPFINCTVNDALVHAMPNMKQTLLQFVDTVHPWLVDSLLDDAPYLVVHPLSCWKMKNSPDKCTSWATAAVTGARHGSRRHWPFAPGSTKMRFAMPSFETTTDTITDLLKVVRVRSRRSAATSFFCVVAGTYRRSFCGFFGISTVTIFSSVNHMKSTWSAGYIFSSIWARCSRTARFVSVTSCTRRLFKHFRPRSLWMMRKTDDCGMPVSLEIWHTEWRDCGWLSWLWANSSTVETFSAVCTVLGRSLPFFRSTVLVSRSFFNNFSKPPFFQFFSGNSLINLRAEQHFGGFLKVFSFSHLFT